MEKVHPYLRMNIKETNYRIYKLTLALICANNGEDLLLTEAQLL